MSKKYYYKDQKVKGHSRTIPKSQKVIKIDSYDRKQKFRRYSNISKAKAKTLFDKRSQRSKTMDLKATSNIVLEIPNEKWAENTGRSDVAGIDTKDKSKQIEEKKDFAKLNLEDLEKKRNTLNDKIEDLRQKAMEFPLDSPEYKKTYGAYSLLLNKKEEIEIDIYNKKYLKGNNIEEILQEGNIEKISYNAEKHLPKKYKKLFSEVSLAHKEIHNNLKELSTNEVELYNLKQWKKEGLDVSEKTISLKKKEQKRLKEKVKQSFEDLKKSSSKSKVDINELEKELDLLNKNKHRFFDKEEELPIIDMGSGYSSEYYTGNFAVMDASRISLLATKKGYKGMKKLYDATKDAKNIYLDKEDSILSSSGNFHYKIEDSYFIKERVDNAVKGFGDQSIDVLFVKEAPLIIRNKDLVYITSARSSDDDTDIPLDYYKSSKTPRKYWNQDIKISQEDFNQIKKSNTKKELIEKANLSKEYSKYNKNELIYHYIIELKTY